MSPQPIMFCREQRGYESRGSMAMYIPLAFCSPSFLFYFFITLCSLSNIYQCSSVTSDGVAEGATGLPSFNLVFSQSYS